MMAEQLIEIKLPKCTLFLSHSEIQALLKSNPEIWKQALQRGKYVKRSSLQKLREKEKAVKEGF